METKAAGWWEARSEEENGLVQGFRGLLVSPKGSGVDWSKPAHADALAMVMTPEDLESHPQARFPFSKGSCQESRSASARGDR